MIDTDSFGASLKNYGFSIFSGVPCSYLTDLINFAVNDCEMVMAANEGDAVAVCAGAYLGGRKSVFLCQNSGLTNAVSPITSLLYTFKIPILGFVSLRGEPGGKPDEPQHELMGGITTGFLDLMGVDWEFLSMDPAEADAQLAKANDAIDSGRSWFFVVKTGTFSPQPLKAQAPRATPRAHESVPPRTEQRSFPSRFEALQEISSLASDETVFLATTGFTGRELHEVGDVPNNFYMVGSMGCVSSLGLGLALARPDLRIVIIDGDGSLLMRMGGSAVLAAHAPRNVVHVLLDNNAHDSTGGQKTISDQIDFPAWAQAVGYERIVDVTRLDQLRPAVENGLDGSALTFVYMQIAPGAKKNLGRPKVRPPEVRERFMKFIGRAGVPA